MGGPGSGLRSQRQFKNLESKGRFAPMLVDAREAAGLTQEQASAKSGVKLGALSNYETGFREPRLSTALTLARAYGLSLDALVGN